MGFTTASEVLEIDTQCAGFAPPRSCRMTSPFRMKLCMVRRLSCFARRITSDVARARGLVPPSFI